MPSRLRHQESFEPFPAETTTRSHLASRQSAPAIKKQKMSLSQTYYIASSARSKLGREASRPDHNLRLLVGHANLLDSLMLELQDAEREQDRWFNQTVSKAQKTDEPKHIQWADTIVEEEADDESISDADSDSDDSDFDETDIQLATTSLRRLKSPPVMITSQPVDSDDSDEEDYYDDMDDLPELALVRTSSQSKHIQHQHQHQHQQPPELVDDSDSDDESSPASPPQPIMDFAFDDKQAGMSETEQATFLENGFFIPDRSTPLITIQA